MAENVSNRPFIQYGRSYKDQIAAARGNPPAGGVATPGGTISRDSEGNVIDAATGRRLPKRGVLTGTTPTGNFVGRTVEDLPVHQGERTFTEAELAAMELADSERIAGMDENEQRAYDLARTGSGAFSADLDRARELTERGSGSFLDADMNAYMNPYIKGALEPAARELQLRTDQDVRDSRLAAQRAGAFGGSRGTILETETRRGGQQAMGDLYAKGYATAFESAKDSFENDRSAAARGAEQFRALGAQRQAQLQQDINALLTTGGLKRQLQQAKLDFNYEQFLTARDWDANNLKPLLAALATVPHSTTQTNTAKTGAMGNVIGIVATVLGAYFGGPQGAQAGAQVMASQQNQGVGMSAPPSSGGGNGTFGQGNQGPPEPGTFGEPFRGQKIVPTSQTFYSVPVNHPASRAA